MIISSFGQDNAYVAYINQYKDIAIEQMNKYHIPASITLAQGLLESGAQPLMLHSTLTVHMERTSSTTLTLSIGILKLHHMFHTEKEQL